MTADERLQRKIEIYRQMTGMERLQVGFEYNDLIRAVVRSVVKFDHPDWSAEQVDQEVARGFFLAAGLSEEQIAEARAHGPERNT